jgi:hypothetical protein
MLPADQARIGNFSDAIRITPGEFTSDQGRLINVLQQDLADERRLAGVDGDRPQHRRAGADAWPACCALVLTDGHDEPMWNQPGRS